MASTNDVCCIGREGGQRKNVNDVGLRWGDIYDRYRAQGETGS